MYFLIILFFHKHCSSYKQHFLFVCIFYWDFFTFQFSKFFFLSFSWISNSTSFAVWPIQFKFTHSWICVFEFLNCGFWSTLFSWHIAYHIWNDFVISDNKTEIFDRTIYYYSLQVISAMLNGPLAENHYGHAYLILSYSWAVEKILVSPISTSQNGRQPLRCLLKQGTGLIVTALMTNGLEWGTVGFSETKLHT